MVQAWLPAVIANTFAIMVLFVMLIDFSRKQHRFRMKDQRVFHWMLITNIVILLLDAGTWVLNRQTFLGARTLNIFFTTAFYCLDPLMSLLYILYCEIKIGTRSDRRKFLTRLYSIPFLINFVLSLISIRASLMFRIGPDNVYSRGSLLALSFFLSYILLAVALFRIVHYRRKVRKQRAIGVYHVHTGSAGPQGTAVLIIFPIVPLMGGIMQIFYCPVTVVWLSTVITLLIVYFNIQNAEIATDSLTGLYNRRQTDGYLQNLLQNDFAEKPICLAILDVDNFKLINDRYGHRTGDRTLQALANVLQTVCGRNIFCSRYGGDEFVLIDEQGNLDRMQQLLQQIDRQLNQYCTALGIECTLSISSGTTVRTKATDSVDALFSAADIQLYRNKSNLKRRAGD